MVRPTRLAPGAPSVDAMNTNGLHTNGSHSEQHDTVIIGAGQAGLSVGYHLRARHREFVILDAGARVGDNWRCHWDSLRLYSAARYDWLTGMPFPA